jgi:hypothetical protein
MFINKKFILGVLMLSGSANASRKLFGGGRGPMMIVNKNLAAQTPVQQESGDQLPTSEVKDGP